MSKLKRVEIFNFRNIEHDDFEIGENGLLISGENNLGKTNRLDAIYYCLVDRFRDGASKDIASSILPNGHDTETTTKIVLHFEYYSEQAQKNVPFIFEKQFSEKWTKNRETKELVFTGYDTKYIINGVDYKKNNAYDELSYVLGYAKTLFTVKQNRILNNFDWLGFIIDPMKIKSLSNDEMRALTLSVIENVNILELVDKYSKVGAELVDYDIQTLLKKYKKEVKEQRANVSILESDLRTQKAKVSNYPEFDLETLKTTKESIENLSKDIYKLESEKENGESGFTAKIDKQINDKQLELSKLRNAKSEEDRKTLELDSKTSMVDYKLKTAKEKKENIKKELFSIKDRLDIAKKGTQFTCEKCGHIHTVGVDENEIKTLNQNGVSKRTEYDSVVLEIETLEKKKVELSKQAILEPFNTDLITNTEKELKDLVSERSVILEQFKEKSLTFDTQIETLKQKRAELSQEIIDYNAYLKDIATQNNFIHQIKGANETLMIAEETLLVLEETWKKYLETMNKLLNDSFGDNFRFELFRETISGEIDSKYTNIQFKDSFGNYVNINNGLNDGLYYARAVEFIGAIKKKYDIPKSFVLIDKFESIGLKNQDYLLSLGENIIATRVVRGQLELELEKL